MKGFTLLEVLIALTILAIALASATRATGVVVDSSLVLKQRILGSWVAKNRLAEHIARAEWLDPGVKTGSAEQAGQTFQWQETVRETQNQRFRSIEIRILARDGDSHALSELTGYLVRTAP